MDLGRDKSDVMWRVLDGDCREVLGTLPEQSVQTCVTSPPYFNLRDYGVDGQLGLEPSPAEFVTALVEVFRAVRRVLRDDGTVWLNLGDSYCTQPQGTRSTRSALTNPDRQNRLAADVAVHRRNARPTQWDGLKPKDLIGIPWRVALALQADGWFLRSDIIWAKPCGLPEAVRDRPTKSHEYLFLLSKAPRYFYDYEAIREESDPDQAAHNVRYAREYEAHSERAPDTGQPGNVNNVGIHERTPSDGKRNKRTVWTVAPVPFPGEHFALFPPKLIEPCILAGCPEGGTVLDPFAGAGTTGMVALRNNRSFVGIELNPKYAAMARERIRDDGPLLNVPSEVAA